MATIRSLDRENHLTEPRDIELPAGDPSPGGPVAPAFRLKHEHVGLLYRWAAEKGTSLSGILRHMIEERQGQEHEVDRAIAQDATDVQGQVLSARHQRWSLVFAEHVLDERPDGDYAAAIARIPDDDLASLRVAAVRYTARLLVDRGLGDVAEDLLRDIDPPILAVQEVTPEPEPDLPPQADFDDGYTRIVDVSEFRARLEESERRMQRER